MNKTTLLLLFIPIIFYALLVFVFPNLIKIKEINCVSQYGPCSSYLTEKLDLLNQKTLREAKKGVVDFLKKESGVSSYSTQYKIPDILMVNVIERKPIFALKDSTNGKFALIDKNGVVLKIVDTSNLPYAKITENFPTVGGLVETKQLFALGIIYDLFSTYQVENGNIESDYFTVDLPRGISVIFPLEGDREVLLGSLSLILSRLNEGGKDTIIEDTRISIIDLRFKNPILR